MKTIAKKKIIEAIRTELQKSINLSEVGRKTANTDAIEAEGRMQTRYGSAKEESQSLEAAYAKKKSLLESQIRALDRIEETTANKIPDVVRGGCVVYLSCPEHSLCVFVSSIGGVEVSVEGIAIITVNLVAPLSRAILGKKVGDQIKLPDGDTATILKIE